MCAHDGAEKPALSTRICSLIALPTTLFCASLCLDSYECVRVRFLLLHLPLLLLFFVVASPTTKFIALTTASHILPSFSSPSLMRAATGDRFFVVVLRLPPTIGVCSGGRRSHQDRQ